MIASEKFKLDQRVQMTKEALEAGLDGRRAKRRTGVVKGFPVRGQNLNELVCVLRDGDRQRKTYHIDFWEPDPDAS